MTYSLLDYGWMVRASARRDAYVAALKRAIKPGSLVIDVGAGPGFFAVLAAKLGAEHVWAVDPDETVHIGKEIARDNGVADKVTFVQGKVEDLSLPRAADVVVADLRGVLPIMRGNFAAMSAARKMLSPTGVLIPRRDTVYVAGIEERADLFVSWDDPFTLAPEGVSLLSARKFGVHQWQKARVPADAICTGAEPWLEIDYRVVEDEPVVGKATLEVTRDAKLRGLAVWFDAELMGGIGFSNAPGKPQQVYGQTIFPLENSRDVTKGTRLEVEIGATFVKDEYDWKWRVDDERHHTMMSRPLAALVRRAGARPPPKDSA